MKTHENIGYELIVNLVPRGSRVLDLGCGDGKLLIRLQKEKDVRGFGVEISEQGVARCVEKGLYCYQGDIDEGLADYRDNSFDYVILNQTLQNTKRPRQVLREIMRIGKHCIISFPNLGHYSIRLKLLLTGTIPKNQLFPYYWYESPDIHKLSIKNFEHLCSRSGYPVETRGHFCIRKSGRSTARRIAPNLFAQYGFFVLDGSGFTSTTPEQETPAGEGE